MMRPIFVLLLFAGTLSGQSAHAGGFKHSEQSAKATGMANAFVALADDPSAVYYNPAAMTGFEDTAVSLGVSVHKAYTTFESAGNLPRGVEQPEVTHGETVSNIDRITPIPHAYAVNRIPGSKLAVGLGIFLPFASGLAWNEDWAGRALGVKSQVAAAAFNPNLALELTPRLSIAAGFSLLQAAVETKQVIRANIGNPAEDITANFGLDGQAYSGNIAFLWQARNDLTLGASYRSAAKAEMTGGVEFTVPHAAYVETFPDQDVSAVYRFPDVVNAGLGWFPTDDLSVDAEIEFVRNNVNENVIFQFVTGNPSPTLVQQNDWHNTVTYRVGANYVASSRWDFRAGFAFDPSPVPDERVSPLEPDADRLVAATGASYYWRGNTFSLGLQWQHLLVRSVTESDIENGAADLPGTYRTERLVAALTWAYAIR